MAVRPIDGNALIEWLRPYLHTGEAIPADVVIEDIRSMPTLTTPNEWVSVKERLPEESDGMVLFTNGKAVTSGYTGSIRVKLYNHSDTAYRVKRGDKISQLVIVPVVIPPLVVVDELEESERGSNGFGSTGR